MTIAQKFKNCRYIKKRVDSEQPIALFGIESPSGWDGILSKMLDSWEASCKKLNAPDEVIYIEQIKEKFGELRVYFALLSESVDLYNELNEAVTIAEKESRATCQLCGAPGDVWDDGWIAILCDACVCKRQAEKFAVKAARL